VSAMFSEDTVAGFQPEEAGDGTRPVLVLDPAFEEVDLLVQAGERVAPGFRPADGPGRQVSANTET
jgi:hypothetical protein